MADSTKKLHSYAAVRKECGDVPASTFATWVAKGYVTPIRIGPRRCFITDADLVRLKTQGTPDVPKAKSRPRNENTDLPKAG